MSTPPISLERYRKGIALIYETLQYAPDGMTAYQLHLATELPRSTVQIILEDNILFYVDRWEWSKRKSPTRIWVAAKIERFEDCPRPDHMK